ncbi:MAG: hypothetical protein IPJ41_09585 [Phycisphaerales bacterium]|nr:hypothetical protein [Phycisphaerales bacterium]
MQPFFHASRPGAAGRFLVCCVAFLATAVCGAGAMAQPAAQRGSGGGGPPGPTAVPDERQASNLAVIPIKEEISALTVSSFLRRLHLAEQGGADAVVIELDTPGGEVLAVQEICNAIRESPIANSIAWVHPRAYSGGAIIALACREIVASSSAVMGDALPISIDQLSRLRELPPAERQKITAPLLAEVVGSARLRGWDEYVVQGFVALGVELWWVRDKATGQEMAVNEAEYRMLFDGNPPRTRPLLMAAPGSSGVPTTPVGPDHGSAAGGKGSGPDNFHPAGPALAALAVDPLEIGHESTRRTISEADRDRFELVGYLCSGDGPLILNAGELAMLGFASNKGPTGAVEPIQTDADLMKFMGAKNIRRLEPSWSEWVVRAMTHNWVRGILIVVFLIALFMELSHPGIGLPGAIAAIALVALLAPPALVGLANWWEIGAIVVGIILIGLELFVIPGFGVPGILGLLLLFGGLLGTFVADSPGSLFPDSSGAHSDMLYGLVTIMLSTATALVGMYFIGKHFGSIPLLGGLVLKSVSGESGEDGEFLAEIPVGGKQLPKTGALGVAVSTLRPSGRVEIGNAVVDAVADFGIIEAGSRVRVVSASDFRIVVSEDPEPAPGREGNA